MKQAILICICAAACSQGSNVSSVKSTTASAALTASGSLDCTPTTAQTDACTGKAVGDACTELIADGGTGSSSGICRSTVDGTGLACTPEHTPRTEAVTACDGKAAGDVCQPDDHYPLGLCTEVDAVLACLAQRAPSTTAVTACATLAAGDDCTLPAHQNHHFNADAGADAGVVDGTCASTTVVESDAGTSTVVACHPLSRQIQACVGIAVGAACTLGNTTGTCEAPASGDATTCVTPCGSAFFGNDFGGQDGHHGFDCNPDGGF